MFGTSSRQMEKKSETTFKIYYQLTKAQGFAKTQNGCHFKSMKKNTEQGAMFRTNLLKYLQDKDNDDAEITSGNDGVEEVRIHCWGCGGG